MERLFRIGSFCFRMICPEEIPIPEHFLQFACAGDAVPEFTYRIQITDRFSETEKKVLARRADLMVYETEGGEGRQIGIKGRAGSYGCYEERSEREADVQIWRESLEELRIDPVFTSLFALERHMIPRGSLILHCAYMVHEGKAVLFSAPSETGKSTQAGLWERYRGSHTVNGDRALLRKMEGTWYACGWPVCGSSEICEIRDTPIHAIVMLRQGKKNSVERLSAFQAFSQLYAQITVNQWNRALVMQAMQAIEDIIQTIPVWQLTCDISEQAVLCLEKKLFPENTAAPGSPMPGGKSQC